MNESKLDISNRLRREGRWAEASLFKDGIIKELRADGLKRPEAQAQAWEQMAERFPPLDIPEADEPGTDFMPEEIAGLPPGSLEEFAAAGERRSTSDEPEIGSERDRDQGFHDTTESVPSNVRPRSNACDGQPSRRTRA